MCGRPLSIPSVTSLVPLLLLTLGATGLVVFPNANHRHTTTPFGGPEGRPPAAGPSHHAAPTRLTRVAAPHSALTWIWMEEAALELRWSKKFSTALNGAVTAYNLSLSRPQDTPKDPPAVASTTMYHPTSLSHQFTGLAGNMTYRGRLVALVGQHYWPYGLLNFTFTSPALSPGHGLAGVGRVPSSNISDLEHVMVAATLRWSHEPFLLASSVGYGRRTLGERPVGYRVTVWNHRHVVQQILTSKNNSKHEGCSATLTNLALDTRYKVTLEGIHPGDTRGNTLSLALTPASLNVAEGRRTTDGVAECYSSLQVRCPGSERCVSPFWICDGSPDCPDGADEAGCDRSPCDGYRCRDDVCLPGAWRCDGYEDCADGEDEWDCPECSAWAVKCPGGGGCVARNLTCDAVLDCQDGWDESGALCRLSCGLDEVQCGVAGSCIPSHKVCDGVPDCPLKEDEESAFCRAYTTMWGPSTDLLTTRDPTTTPNLVSPNDPATTTDLVSPSDPATTTDLVSPSDAVTTHDLVALSNSATTPVLVAQSNPVTTPDLVSPNDPVTTRDLVSPSDPTTTRDLVSPSDPTTTRDLAVPSDPEPPRVLTCNETEERRCTSQEFRCASGECTPRAAVCDGVRDCDSGDDEEFPVCRLVVRAEGQGNGSCGEPMVKCPSCVPSGDDITKGHSLDTNETDSDVSTAMENVPGGDTEQVVSTHLSHDLASQEWDEQASEGEEEQIGGGEEEQVGGGVEEQVSEGEEEQIGGEEEEQIGGGEEEQTSEGEDSREYSGDGELTEATTTRSIYSIINQKLDEEDLDDNMISLDESYEEADDSFAVSYSSMESEERSGPPRTTAMEGEGPTAAVDHVSYSAFPFSLSSSESDELGSFNGDSDEADGQTSVQPPVSATRNHSTNFTIDNVTVDDVDVFTQGPELIVEEPWYSTRPESESSESQGNSVTVAAATPHMDLDANTSTTSVHKDESVTSVTYWSEEDVEQEDSLEAQISQDTISNVTSQPPLEEAELPVITTSVPVDSTRSSDTHSTSVSEEGRHEDSSTTEETPLRSTRTSVEPPATEDGGYLSTSVFNISAVTPGEDSSDHKNVTVLIAIHGEVNISEVPQYVVHGLDGNTYRYDVVTIVKDEDLARKVELTATRGPPAGWRDEHVTSLLRHNDASSSVTVTSALVTLTLCMVMPRALMQAG